MFEKVTNPSAVWDAYKMKCVKYNVYKWIRNYVHYKVWDDITYTFRTFNSFDVDDWEWVSNLIPHFTGFVITYPCWD